MVSSIVGKFHIGEDDIQKTYGSSKYNEMEEQDGALRVKYTPELEWTEREPIDSQCEIITCYPGRAHQTWTTPILLHFPGGVLYRDPSPDLGFCSTLSQATAAIVVVINYGTTTNHHPMKDVFARTRNAVEHIRTKKVAKWRKIGWKLEGSQVTIVTSSWGSMMATHLMIRALNASYITHIIMIVPLIDTRPDEYENSGPWMEKLKQELKVALQGSNPNCAEYNPYLIDSKLGPNLPPISIYTATDDPLSDKVRQWYSRLLSANEGSFNMLRSSHHVKDLVSVEGDELRQAVKMKIRAIVRKGLPRDELLEYDEYFPLSGHPGPTSVGSSQRLQRTHI